MSLSTRASLTAIVLAASLTAAQAQTAQDHAAHHPGDAPAGETQAPPEQQVPPGNPGTPPGQAGRMPAPGMMGPDGAGGKMGADMGRMMEMMSRMMGAMGSGGDAGMPPSADDTTHMGQMMQSMAQIMGTMGRMMEEGSMGAAAETPPVAPAERRVAILKAQLGITEEQLPQWTAFADALRSGPQKVRAAYAEALQGGPPVSAPARAAGRVKMLSARREALKATASAEKSLYAVLTDEQKQTADELLSGPMGRM